MLSLAMQRLEVVQAWPEATFLRPSTHHRPPPATATAAITASSTSTSTASAASTAVTVNMTSSPTSHRESHVCSTRPRKRSRWMRTNGKRQGTDFARLGDWGFGSAVMSQSIAHLGTWLLCAVHKISYVRSKPNCNDQHSRDSEATHIATRPHTWG